MHPAEVGELVEAWKRREARDDHRTALRCYVTAMASGMKKRGGGRLTMSDFLPDHAKTEENEGDPEEILKAKFQQLAKRTKRNG